MDFARPSAEAVQTFQNAVREASAGKLHVSVRVTRGDEEMAACGQLVTSRAASGPSSARVAV